MKIMLAGCVILNKNKILLLHRKKTDWYELPGGKIDDSELPEQAAKRELKEELCCDVKIIKNLGSKDFIEDGYTMGYTWFLGKIKKGQNPKVGEPEKFDRFEYLSIKELSQHELSFNMKNLLLELETGNILLTEI